MLKFVLNLFIIVVCIAVCNCRSVDNNGKYQFSKNNDVKNNEGKYIPTRNEGVYIHKVQPYRHIYDNRELGFYVHIPYPYDGGYGPYSGKNLPYVHVDVPYDHNKYTTTTTTTKKPTTTTTTTTTPAPAKFKYKEEGNKILHQEEYRKSNKYDHSFLTENGIYGEEQAKLLKHGGTHAKGYYEYTGDDGKLYRVKYKSNDGGFMPEGDHIPTPPPIPDAIARALKWVDDRRKAKGEMPMFDERGFRIDHMTKNVLEMIKSIKVEEDMPKDIAQQITKLQHDVEDMEIIEVNPK